MASSIDNQIRSLVNQANNYQNQINASRARYDAALSKKRQYEQRLQQVRSVKQGLSGNLDHQSESALRKQRGALDFERAVRGGRTVSAVVAELNANLERHFTSDSQGSQVDSCLQREISRCEQEISNAQNEMNSNKASMDRASNMRSSCIQRARTLSANEKATVKVR